MSSCAAPPVLKVLSAGCLRLTLVENCLTPLPVCLGGLNREEFLAIFTQKSQLLKVTRGGHLATTPPRGFHHVVTHTGSKTVNWL